MFVLLNLISCQSGPFHIPSCFYAECAMGSGNDAEDVVEEVFIQCWTNAQVFDSEDQN